MFLTNIFDFSLVIFILSPKMQYYFTYNHILAVMMAFKPTSKEGLYNSCKQQVQYVNQFNKVVWMFVS